MLKRHSSYSQEDYGQTGVTKMQEHLQVWKAQLLWGGDAWTRPESDQGIYRRVGWKGKEEGGGLCKDPEAWENTKQTGTRRDQGSGERSWRAVYVMLSRLESLKHFQKDITWCNLTLSLNPHISTICQESLLFFLKTFIFLMELSFTPSHPALASVDTGTGMLLRCSFLLYALIPYKCQC